MAACCFLRYQPKMQSITRSCAVVIASHSFKISLLFTMFLAETAGQCRDQELTGYTTGSTLYTSPGFERDRQYDYIGEVSQKLCRVLFRSAYDADNLKIQVVVSDLKPRNSRNECESGNVVTFYDGSSTDYSVLQEFCGNETPVIESTGNTVLMVFESKHISLNRYKGFRLEYSSLDRGGYDVYKSSSSVGVGTIVGVVIPAVILYCVLFVFVYKRCKYAQLARENLSNPAAPPVEMSMATTLTILDQGCRGPLLNSQPALNGHARTIMNDCPNMTAMVPPKCSIINHNQQPQKKRRVRHPAGDVRNGDVVYLPPPLLFTGNISSMVDDACSGYGSERDESLRLFSQDPSGVYYAGNVDENGILHPPEGQGYPVYPLVPAPSIASSSLIQSYLSHHIEDDRRSRGSSRRSPYASGRNSPREGSSGRGSPFRSRGTNPIAMYSGASALHSFLEPEGQTFTYYGMIDGIGGETRETDPGLSNINSTAEYVDQSLVVPPVPSYEDSLSLIVSSPPSYEENHDLQAPPSYEDAATGKYSPNYAKL